MQLENTLVLATRGIARPGNPRVSSHRWFRTRGVSARRHSGRTDRGEKERDHPLVRHPLPDGPHVGRMQVFTSRTPERRARTAVTPYHPALGPSRANSYLRSYRECVPPRRQTGKRISESIKVADSIIRRAR